MTIVRKVLAACFASLLLTGAHITVSSQESVALKTRLAKAVETNEPDSKLEDSNVIFRNDDLEFDFVYHRWRSLESRVEVSALVFTSAEEASDYLRSLKKGGDYFVPNRKVVEALPPAAADEGFLWEGFGQNAGLHGQILRKNKVVLYISAASPTVAGRFALLTLNIVSTN